MLRMRFERRYATGRCAGNAGLERPAYIRFGATRLPTSMPIQTEQMPSKIGLILVPLRTAPVPPHQF
jgi:hypothetical protein